MEESRTHKRPVIGFLKESLCIGGTERSAANISKILENDYELYFILFDGSDITYPYGGKPVDIKAPPMKTLPGKVLNSFIRYFKVRKHIKQNKIDILYEFIAIENFLSYTTYKGVTKVISARDFGKMQRETGRFAKALSKSGAMICNSEFTKEFYLSKYPEHKDKVFTVYNVIDTDEIIAEAKEVPEQAFSDFVSAHKKTVVSVGRFCKEKGFEYLLRAFAKARETAGDIGLVLVGDGAYREKYEDVINEQGLKDCVYLAGFQKNPYKYMTRCDCFVLSSLSEGFPNVLAEAMALGLPVIAANCHSGPAEVLRDDCDYDAVTDRFAECDYGIITPRMTDGDNTVAINQLASAMEHLLADEELMKKYALLSSQRVTAFSRDAAKQKLNTIFELLINRNNNKSIL